jgi:Protein of unknown function (DUF4239)
VIHEAWPQQRIGQVPTNDTQLIDRFQKVMFRFQPGQPSEMLIHQEALTQFNRLVDLRRKRLFGINAGLPSTLWYVICFGALLNIALTWFFQTDTFRVHLVMSIFLAALLGSLVFLVAAMDNPYRGEFSVSPAAFELVYSSLMNK